MQNEALIPELCTVAELFGETDSIYLVPVYQRSYSWRSEQIEQLINDIRDAIAHNEDSYFLGNLTVTTRGTQTAEYEVIDGQQRLTTLYLLLTFIGRTDNSSGPSFRGHASRLRYESRPRSSEALRRLDGGYPEIGASTARGSLEDSGIHQGYNIIQQHMDQLVTGNDLATFSTYLLNRVQLVRASLPESTDLNRYFEVMNTRGQQLRSVDIVKARLMSYLADDSERGCFAWVWDACADIDTYVQGPLTRGNPALRDKLFGHDWSRLVISDFTNLLESFNEAETLHSGTPSQPSSQASSLSLDGALAQYSEVAGLELADSSDSERFNSPIQFTSLLLHTLKLFDARSHPVEEEGGLDDKRLIKLFSEKFSVHHPERVQQFIVLLLQARVAFDAFVLKREYLGSYSDEGEWSLRRVIKSKSGRSNTIGYRNTFSVDTGNDNDVADNPTRELLLLQSMLRVTDTAPRTMHWITLVLRHVLRSEKRDVALEQELVKLLRSHVRARVREAFPLDDEPLGFNIPRVVFAYVDYLLLLEGYVPEIDRDFMFSFRTSIEHFYPQNPDEQQSGEQVSNRNLHVLGNLALVSVGSNSKFNNSLPHAKATNYKRTIEIQSPKLHLMAARTRHLGKWGDGEVEGHHNEIVNLLRRDLNS